MRSKRVENGRPTPSTASFSRLLPTALTLPHPTDPVPLSLLLSNSAPAIYHLSLLSFLAVRSTEKKYTTLLSACFPIQ